MSSAINKLLDEIRFKIPRQILELVFVQKDLKWRQAPPSIDEQIMASVIRPRLLVDCNLVGGAEVFIPLDGCPVERSNDYTSVYRIPKSYTNGRSINSVLNITFSDPTKLSSYGVAAGQQNTMMLQVGSSVMDAMGSIPVTSTARVQLIGENVVMVRDTVVLPANIYLRCILANDENMSHLQMRSYHHFSNLGVLAVKAYIYNNFIVQMDMGELFAGVSLGRIKDIIDSYADAEELYSTYLVEKWTKVAFMNDGEQMQRYIKMQVGGSR
jgi:hypothetical protein